MSSDLELPAELMSRPLALVGLTGLHVETNQTHLLIWNSFTSSNRNERPPLNFILFGVNHTFPVAKPDVIVFKDHLKMVRKLILLPTLITESII